MKKISKILYIASIPAAIICIWFAFGIGPTTCDPICVTENVPNPLLIFIVIFIINFLISYLVIK